LLELFGITKVGGLSENYAIRAPFVEAIYGEMKSLYFIAGPKIISIADTRKEIAEVINTIYTESTFDEQINNWLALHHDFKNIIAESKGKPHHVITFDLSYLDVGISSNITNNTYDEFASAKTPALPMGRGNVPSFTHILLYTKAALTSDLPDFITTLSADIRYLHTEIKDKPLKDKTKLGLTLRVPFERSIMSESSVVISPLFKTIYDTKLAPNFLLNNSKMPPRTKRLDSLLGVNIDFNRLGFNVDVGPVMAIDFNRLNFQDATDFGPGVNFFSKWPLFGPLELSADITSYYLFPLPGNSVMQKVAFVTEGKVWLRLARFYDFSIAALSDFLFVTMQNEPSKFAVSSIFGLTVSYGRLFRLLG